MKALLIKPKTGTGPIGRYWSEEVPFVWVDLPEEDEDRLAKMQILVGGFIEPLPSPFTKITFWGNENAKTIGLLYNAVVTAVLHPMLAEGDYIAGDVLVLGERIVSDEAPPEDISLYEPEILEEIMTYFFGLIDYSYRRHLEEQK